MPRKQRFKPSRKPKPIPQSEDATLDRQPSSAPANNAQNDNVEPPTERDDVSMNEPDFDRSSR